MDKIKVAVRSRPFNKREVRYWSLYLGKLYILCMFFYKLDLLGNSANSQAVSINENQVILNGKDG